MSIAVFAMNFYAGSEYNSRFDMPAMYPKSLSSVKTEALCSMAIAAIRVSIVLSVMPFSRALRKMEAAALYVRSPLGSNMSHCARYCSISAAFRVSPCKTSAATIPVSAKGSAVRIIRRSSAPAAPGEELKKSIQTEVSTRIKRGFSATSSDPPSKCRFRSSERLIYGSPIGRATPRLVPQSAALFSIE